MTEIDKDFLKDVFKEVNAHIRATDRKSLAVTGVYISLFSVFLSSIAIGRWSGAELPPHWTRIAIQGFFLIIGICIYIMQQWYRAWKEHYLDVCLAIRKQFLPDPDYPGLLPYWLRQEIVESKVSIDNILKNLTLVINFISILIISYDLLETIPNRNLATLLVVLLILSYIGLIVVMDRVVRKSRTLFA